MNDLDLGLADDAPHHRSLHDLRVQELTTPSMVVIEGAVEECLRLSLCRGVFHLRRCFLWFVPPYYDVSRIIKFRFALLQLQQTTIVIKAARFTTGLGFPKLDDVLLWHA